MRIQFFIIFIQIIIQLLVEFLEGRQQSPYPDVDIFISNKLSKDGIKGYIRQWTYFTHGELLLYEIAKNRWCENIGRQHKSNNIMYVSQSLPNNVVWLFFNI